MKVKATAAGFFDSYRNVGDEFEVPKDAEGSWFVPVKAGKKGASQDSAAPEGDAQGGDAPTGDANALV